MYRAYDSGLARWVSEDPAGLDDGPNLYAYVGGNPLNLIDPLGLNAGTCEQDDPTPDPKKLKECLKACEIKQETARGILSKAEEPASESSLLGRSERQRDFL